jgi:hypothetical protein
MGSESATISTGDAPGTLVPISKLTAHRPHDNQGRATDLQRVANGKPCAVVHAMFAIHEEQHTATMADRAGLTVFHHETLDL